jgi:hypothetical protein
MVKGKYTSIAEWFMRNTAEVAALAEGKGFNVYLSHDGAVRYSFARLVESPTPAAVDSAIVFAMSRTPDGHAPLVDLSPAKDVLGYEPQDSFPSGCRSRVQEIVRSYDGYIYLGRFNNCDVTTNVILVWVHRLSWRRSMSHIGGDTLPSARTLETFLLHSKPCPPEIEMFANVAPLT